MTYQWKDNARVRGVSAQVAGERLHEIRETHGSVTPETVLDDARNPESPLHPAFEWRDEVAAERFRVGQASYMIRSIVVQSSTADSTPFRVFIHVPSTDEDEPRGEYMTRAEIMSDDDLRRATLLRALMASYGELRDYEDEPELQAVVRAIHRTRKALGGPVLAEMGA
jgi:hypothetical protein